jgi:hypothetical protein
VPIRYALLALILGVFFGLLGTCALAALAIIILVFTFKAIGDCKKLCEKLREQEDDFQALQDEDFCDWQN